MEIQGCPQCNHSEEGHHHPPKRPDRPAISRKFRSHWGGGWAAGPLDFHAKTPCHQCLPQNDDLLRSSCGMTLHSEVAIKAQHLFSTEVGLLRGFWARSTSGPGETNPS